MGSPFGGGEIDGKGHGDEGLKNGLFIEDMLNGCSLISPGINYFHCMPK